MKYADIELLTKEIDSLYDKWCGSSTGLEVAEEGASIDTAESIFKEVRKIIDSLQQEQQESSKGNFVFPNFLYARTVDNKTIDVSYAPQSMDAVEYIKNDSIEQQKVDLEKIIGQTYHDGSVTDTSDMNHVDYENIARHFYELGQQEMRHRITNPEYNAKVVEQLKSEYPIIKEE